MSVSQKGKGGGVISPVGGCRGRHTVKAFSYCPALTELCSWLWRTGLSGSRLAASEHTDQKHARRVRADQEFHSVSSGGRAAYRGRVVSECLQVSDIGVDQPPRALDVRAHVVVGSIGDGDSHAVRCTSGDQQRAVESH